MKNEESTTERQNAVSGDQCSVIGKIRQDGNGERLTATAGTAESTESAENDAKTTAERQVHGLTRINTD